MVSFVHTHARTHTHTHTHPLSPTLKIAHTQKPNNVFELFLYCEQ